MDNSKICQICENDKGNIIEYSWVDAHKICADNYIATNINEEVNVEEQIIDYELYVIGEY